MELDPSKYDILLVGPRVARLEPFFASRGYRTTACDTGAEGLNTLRSSKHHVVALELELTDLGAREFLRQALQYAPLSSYVLLDDPSRTGMIVSTLVEGADAYVPTPPDENRLFGQIARHAHAAAARGGAPTETEQYETELEQARTALATTGARVRALTDEKAALEKREATFKAEVDKLQKELAQAKAKRGGGGPAMSEEELAELKASKDFAAFLETENDALKDEIGALKSKLDELGARLKSVGLPMPALDGLGDKTGEVHIDLGLGTPSAVEEFFEVRSDPAILDDPFSEGTDTGERPLANINSPMSSDGPTIHTPAFTGSRVRGLSSAPSEDSIELDLEEALRSSTEFEENTDSQLGGGARRGGREPLRTEFSSGPVGAEPGSRTEAGDATAFDEPTVNASEMGGAPDTQAGAVPGPFTGFDEQSSVFARAEIDDVTPQATPGLDGLPAASDAGEGGFGWTAAPTMAVDSPYTGEPGVELDLDDESEEFAEPTLNPHMDLKNIPTQSGNGPPVPGGDGGFEDATLMLDPVEAVEMANLARKRRGKG